MLRMTMITAFPLRPNNKYSFHYPKVDAVTNIITTVAGVPGLRGHDGEASAATSARLSFPSGVSFDAFDNMYITDSFNNAIRQVNTDSPPLISTCIGTLAGYSTDINGVDYAGGYTGDNGPAANTISGPCGSNACLDLGSYSAPSLPFGIAHDTDGSKYVADTLNNVIRKVSPGGIITTAYGNQYLNNNPNPPPNTISPWTCQYDGDGELAISTHVKFCSPTDLVFDRVGNLYISDYGNNRVRKVRNHASSLSTSHPQCM